MEKIIITGSSGFIATNLTKYLVDRGICVIECDRVIGYDVSSLVNDIIKKNMYEDVKTIVHLAAQTSVFNEDVLQIEEDNVKSFIQLVDACNKKNKRLIFASSSCAFNVTSMYGLSKLFDEKYAEIYSNNYVAVRLHNVYGQNCRKGTLLYEIIKSSKEKKDLVLYNKGLNKRHFTFIEDVCESFYKIINSKIKGLVNVANQRRTSVMDFVQICKKYIDVNQVMSNEIRKYDKPVQYLEYVPIIDIEYTSVEDGLRKVFTEIK